MSYWRKPLDQDRILIRHGIVHVIRERCKGCGICVEFCPRKLLSVSTEANSKGYYPPDVADRLHCTKCGLCVLLCPDFAIYVEDGGEHPPDRVISINKREDV